MNRNPASGFPPAPTIGKAISRTPPSSDERVGPLPSHDQAHRIGTSIFFAYWSNAETRRVTPICQSPEAFNGAFPTV